MVSCAGELITPADLPSEATGPGGADEPRASAPLAVGVKLKDVERDVILKTLAAVGNNKTRAAQRVYAEPSGTIGLWLFRIRREDLQIGCRTERDECIARALARVLSTRRGVNPQQCLDALDAGREVGRRVHEMIDLPEA